MCFSKIRKNFLLWIENRLSKKNAYLFAAVALQWCKNMSAHQIPLNTKQIIFARNSSRAFHSFFSGMLGGQVGEIQCRLFQYFNCERKTFVSYKNQNG